MPIIGRISVGDGATFTPDVSNEGVLSWTNNKNLENPASVDIPQAVINRFQLAPIDSPAFSGTPTAPTPTDGDNSTKVATTEFVNAKAGNYLPLSGGTVTGDLTVTGTLDGTASGNLPLSGGTMTGEIVVKNTTVTSRRDVTNSWNLILGGTSDSDGAYIRLDGMTSSEAGCFILRATDDTNSSFLVGHPDGTFTWNGQNILTTSNYNSYALPLSGGTLTGPISSTSTLAFQSKILEKGINPSAETYPQWVTYYDKNGFADSNRICGIGGILTSSGEVNYGLIAYKYTASSTNFVGAYITFPSTGDPSFRPSTDNTITLGRSANRWKQLYAGTATINTSDERLKDNIEAIPDEVLDAWGKVNWYQYQFKDSLAEKGEKARIHTGAIAQRIESVFKSHGLDANRYGLLCYDEWEAEEESKDEDGNVVQEAREAGNRYSLRYEEALCMEASYQRRRADRLEARIEALEKLLKK